MHPIIFELKQIKQQIADKHGNESMVRLAIKEYLQDWCLNFIFNHSEYKQLIFYGGTCLRKMYNLNRLSEDMDFESLTAVKLQSLGTELTDYFIQLGLSDIYFSTQSSQDIGRITLKFPILYELGLSPSPKENLHLKVEINMHPTGHYQTTTTPHMTGSQAMIIKHYDLPTLMSCKIITCLKRSYVKGKTGITIKGRDYYDLIWFMQKNIIPDPKKIKDSLNKEDQKKYWLMLDEKIAKIKSKDLLSDLEPLFIEKNFVRDWCKNFHHFYQKLRINYE